MVRGAVRLREDSPHFLLGTGGFEGYARVSQRVFSRDARRDQRKKGIPTECRHSVFEASRRSDFPMAGVSEGDPRYSLRIAPGPSALTRASARKRRGCCWEIPTPSPPVVFASPAIPQLVRVPGLC